MFEASAPFALFDYFRVPHRCVTAADDASGTDRVAVAGAAPAPALNWPDERLLSGEAGRPDLHFVRSIPIFGRVLGDAQIRALTRRTPGAWKPVDIVRDARGTAVSAIWRADDGSSLLPFDPNEVISNFWTESYVELGPTARVARLASLARHGYYRARPLLPRRVQMLLRRTFGRVQRKARFP